MHRPPRTGAASEHQNAPGRRAPIAAALSFRGPPWQPAQSPPRITAPCGEPHRGRVASRQVARPASSRSVAVCVAGVAICIGSVAFVALSARGVAVNVPGYPKRGVPAGARVALFVRHSGV